MKIKPIPNFPNYFISDTGILLSKMQRVNQPKSKRYRELSTWLTFGYKSITLQKDKKPHKRFIHRLVLETFVGFCPEGLQCRHLDSDKLNNNLANLKWGTRSENQMDRLKVGNDNRGEKHGKSRLTSKQVLEIRKLGLSYNKRIRKLDKGGNYKNIAKIYKVSPSTIGHIIRRSTWKCF